MKKLMITLSVCAIALALPQAQAGSLNENQVAANAKWALHLDLQKLRATQIGGEVNQRMYAEEVDRKMKSLTAVFRMDPRKDLHGITLYGSGDQPEEAVALLTGQFDGEHLATIIQGSEDYVGSSHNGAAVHQWTDKGKVNYGSIHDNTIIISQGKAMVTQALDVLGGSTEALGNGSALSATAGANAEAFLTVAADLSGMGKLDPKAQMLQHAKKAGLTLHETARHVVGTMNIEAKDAEVAAQLNTMVAGIIAAGALHEQPELNQLANSTKVTLNGNTISVRIMLPTADLMKLMDKQDDWQKQF